MAMTALKPASTTESRLVAKVERFVRLSREEREALLFAGGAKIRQFDQRDDIIQDGAQLNRISLVLDGWACCYKDLEDGRRQIASFVLPGDFCDGMFLLQRIDHAVGAITPVTIAEIAPEALDQLRAQYPRVELALRWFGLVEQSISRAWIVNIGQRLAAERIAHLFCEVFYRLRAVGLATDNSCEFPVTQEQLADATGMSTVHVNRSLMQLRGEGLISLKDKTLFIPDLDTLQSVAMFDPAYLHLSREGRQYDAPLQ